MTWRALRFYGAKNHIVPSHLVQEIIDDLLARKCELESSEPITECGIDQPGMLAVGRPCVSFDLNGLEIDMPCEDVATFLLHTDGYKLRGNYYKVHGWLTCVVMTPAQFKQYRAVLARELPDSEQRAAEFWAGRAVYSEVLRETAAKLSGTPLDKIPNLGGNKADRFKAPKVIGKA